MNNLPNDIQEIDKRIRNLKTKSSQNAKPKYSRLRSFCEYAFRMAADFAAPVIVGLCIGYVFDRLLGSKPIGMLVLAMFGVAAGTLNLYRAAQQVDKDMNKE
ncbi:MAG: AtpZ/AtpI family protein [Alphaproteobacteria bacterium]|nr:AtpZ/AtpI family protein [Alphaproteobacteria bacterium]